MAFVVASSKKKRKDKCLLEHGKAKGNSIKKRFSNIHYV